MNPLPPSVVVAVDQYDGSVDRMAAVVSALSAVLFPSEASKKRNRDDSVDK